MLRKLILAGAIVAVSTGLALAQSAPSPKSTAGSDVKSTQNSPTGMGSGSETSNTKAQPGGKMGENNKMKGRGTTTGSGTGTNPQADTLKKNASPASGAEGAGKVK